MNIHGESTVCGAGGARHAELGRGGGGGGTLFRQTSRPDQSDSEMNTSHEECTAGVMFEVDDIKQVDVSDNDTIY